jgi:hypothetical protein
MKKNLKTFEEFSNICERCGSDGITTMSIFNTQTICLKCKELEKKDPDYDAAVKAERDAVSRGDYNFPGVYPDYKPLNL